MTAKEKAQELFMRNFEITVDDYCAKQCALIAVDEMLYWTNEQDTLIWLNDFYSEVKQEITQL